MNIDYTLFDTIHDEKELGFYLNNLSEQDRRAMKLMIDLYKAGVTPDDYNQFFYHFSKIGN